MIQHEHLLDTDVVGLGAVAGRGHSACVDTGTVPVVYLGRCVSL